MKNNVFILAIAFVTLFSLTCSTSAFAVGGKEAAASLILPTTGQSMNGELGHTKTKIMAGAEFSLITATAVLGAVVGGPIVWVAAAPLAVNHVWSSADAYKSARRNYRNGVSNNLQAAQQNLDLSRDQRYEREQQYRSDIYERVRAAGASQG